MSEVKRDQLLEQMSKQMEELLRHIAEVPRSNRTLETRFDSLETRFEKTETELRKEIKKSAEGLREDVSRMMNGLEQRITGRLDHFIETAIQEDQRFRLRIEHEIADRKVNAAEYSERFGQIEERLTKLEEAQAG